MEPTIAQRIARQAQACGAMGSPLYAALLAQAADASGRPGPLRDLLNANAERSRIGLRLMGALHACALDGTAPALAAHFPSAGGDGDPAAAWRAASELFAAQPARVARLLERVPQTNEVARSMPLMAASLAAVARRPLPMRIFEVGSSAGLNLRWDSYGYAGAGWAWGDAASPLQLRNRIASGRPANLEAHVEIAERRGCDLNPLDPCDPAHRQELLSFVWADQVERFDRLRAALLVAERVAVAIDRADGVEWIERVRPSAGSLTVVMHSVVTEHLPRAMRDALRAAIARVGARAADDSPVAWIAMEPGEGAYETRVRLWPESWERLVARSDGHAQDIRWSEAA
ncbi:MAG TPA: DUF2332 domain-containing protein [Candidatus Baltobacteraceae bacterium]|jgi:hypothetical protein